MKIWGIAIALVVITATVAAFVTEVKGYYRREAEHERQRMQDSKAAEARRDEIKALDDGGLLDRLGRWIMPAQ